MSDDTDALNAWLTKTQDTSSFGATPTYWLLPEDGSPIARDPSHEFLESHAARYMGLWPTVRTPDDNNPCLQLRHVIEAQFWCMPPITDGLGWQPWEDVTTDYGIPDPADRRSAFEAMGPAMLAITTMNAMREKAQQCDLSEQEQLRLDTLYVTQIIEARLQEPFFTRPIAGFSGLLDGV